MTTIVITHDMNSVMETGENIMFLYQGKNWWQGDNHEIVKSDNKELSEFVFASKIMKQFRNA